MHPKDAEEIANSVDPDQTADLGLHCLPRSVCRKLRNFTVYKLTAENFTPRNNTEQNNHLLHCISMKENEIMQMFVHSHLSTDQALVRQYVR